jgi:hypothetical protein
MALGILLWHLGQTPESSDSDAGGGILTITASILSVLAGGYLVFSTPFVVFYIVRDIIYKCSPRLRQKRDAAAEAARLRPTKEAEVKAIQQRVDGEIANERIRLEKERDALMAKVLKVDKTNAKSPRNQASFGVVLISIPAERPQREILAVVVSKLNPNQTTPRFKALLEGRTALEPSLPVKILTGVARTEAVAVASQFNAAGARAELECEQPG